jgi:hypothetical protein
MKGRKGGCVPREDGKDQRKVMGTIFTADFRFGTTKIVAERTDRRIRNVKFSGWEDLRGAWRSTPLVGNFLCMGFSGGVGELIVCKIGVRT